MPRMLSCIQVHVLACFASTLVGYSKGVPTPAPTEPVKTYSDGVDYLSKYGLLPAKNDIFTGALRTVESMKNAVIRFQRMAGVKQTGVMDDSTLKAMNLPRCGVSDQIGQADAARRRKRYALQGSDWRPKIDLTYRVIQYTKDMGKEYVDYELDRSFKVWSAVTPLKFSRKDTGPVDIKVIFARGGHGDGDPFDGPGQTLAHAYFPRFGGDVHFDDDERWTVRSRRGTNLYQVATHEIGHSLGLAHSDVYTALMAPFYRGYVDEIKLDEDDLSAIQELYGMKSVDDKRPVKPEKPQTRVRNKPGRPPPSGTPDLCQEVDFNIDAATTTADGVDYFFRGEYYWRLRTHLGVESGYPRQISEDWKTLPNNIDAALTWPNGNTYFFKGKQYWKFHNMELRSGYPRLIRNGFSGVPDDIQTAFVWSGNGKTYFIKGGQYWRYTGLRVDYGYPKPLTVWRGLPARIDTAFKWKNGKTYFFKGPEYYRFNDTYFRVDNKYPRSTSRIWLGCQSRLTKSSTKTDSTDNSDSGTDTKDTTINGKEIRTYNGTDPLFEGQLDGNSKASHINSLSKAFMVSVLLLLRVLGY